MDRKKGQVHEVSEQELREKLGEEKRTSMRHAARLEIDIPLASWDQAKRVFTTNVSQGGLLFSLPSPASIAGEIDLVLTLPNGEKVKLPAEVRHVSLREGTREFDVGVQFGELDPDMKKKFEDALKAIG